MLDGEGALHADGDRTAVAAGSCIQLPARTVHCLENTGDGRMRVVAVFRRPARRRPPTTQTARRRTRDAAGHDRMST